MAILQKAYAYVSLLTIGLGFIVSILFAAGFVIGGSTGEELALISQNIMTLGIRLATVAVLFGIVYIYLSKEHSLTMDLEQDQVKKNDQLKKVDKEEPLKDSIL